MPHKKKHNIADTDNHEGQGDIVTHNVAEFAPAAEGVTNGNAHDHDGGDGAQIDHTKLSNIGSTSHTDLDAHVAAAAPHSGHEAAANKGVANGYASLDANVKVVEDPANATAVPAANKIPIADGDNRLAIGWMPESLARTVNRGAKKVFSGTTNIGDYIDITNLDAGGRYQIHWSGFADNSPNNTAAWWYVAVGTSTGVITTAGAYRYCTMARGGNSYGYVGDNPAGFGPYLASLAWNRNHYFTFTMDVCLDSGATNERPCFMNSYGQTYDTSNILVEVTGGGILKPVEGGSGVLTTIRLGFTNPGGDRHVLSRINVFQVNA